MSEFLTEEQRYNLLKIRKMHDASGSDGGRSGVGLVEVAKIRHEHRGELLDIVDTLLAVAGNYKNSCQHWFAVAKEANKQADQEAVNHVAAQQSIDAWHAEAQRLGAEANELRVMRDNLKRDLGGTTASFETVRGTNKLLEVANAALQQDVIRLERENANLRSPPPGCLIKVDDASRWFVERMPGVSMRLSVLVERYNRVADVIENG